LFKQSSVIISKTRNAENQNILGRKNTLAISKKRNNPRQENSDKTEQVMIAG
jgi:hypothetical protein